MERQTKPSRKPQLPPAPQPLAASHRDAAIVIDIRRQLGWGLVQGLHKGLLR